MKQQVKVKKLNSKAILPTYGSKYSAGSDLYACMDVPVDILPGETVLVKTGLATKKGLAPANKVGVIDADYRGEIMVPLYNHSHVAVTVGHGERIAQMVITPFLTAEYLLTEELDETERGEGGFGSTGVK